MKRSSPVLVTILKSMWSLLRSEILQKVFVGYGLILGMDDAGHEGGVGHEFLTSVPCNSFARRGDINVLSVRSPPGFPIVGAIRKSAKSFFTPAQVFLPRLELVLQDLQFSDLASQDFQLGQKFLFCLFFVFHRLHPEGSIRSV